MKKLLKKCISFVILFSFLSMPINVFAALGEELIKNSEISIPLTTSYETVGSLEVDLEWNFPIQNERENIINIELIDENNNAINLDINLKQSDKQRVVSLNGKDITVEITKANQDRNSVGDGEDYRYFNIKFSNLPVGNYQVHLRGNGFVEYLSEKILIKEYSRRIYLSNQLGTFAIGEVTKDNIIDTQDYQKMQERIGSTNQEDLINYDLNCDGKIDIIDLSYIAKNLGEETKQAKIENTEPIIAPEDIKKIATTEDTIVNGKIEELLTNSSEIVSFKNKKEEPISEENPVVISLEFNRSLETQQITMYPNSLTDANIPKKMQLEIETQEGEKLVIPYEKQEAEVAKLSEDTENVIVISLGKQVAVKKITITIIETKNNTNLAEIAKVEFLNNVYEQIPAPKMDVPTGLAIQNGSEKITATWNHATNITGYKVKITGGEKNQVFETSKNSFTISDLKNYTEYKVSVASVNGTWESGYSEEVTAIPIPTRLPPAPENVKLTGHYKRIDVAWKKMDDTQKYAVYYRKVGETGFQKIENINSTSYTINDLEDTVEYEVAVAGINHLGEGKKSTTYKTKTIGIEAPITHNYKLINTVNGVNEKTSHIETVEYSSNSATKDYDTFDIVDNDYTSYWQFNSWDAGGYNAGKPSPIIVFDATYQMDNVVVIPADSQKYKYDYCKIRYWNEAGEVKEVANINMQRKQDVNGKVYYEFNFKEPIEAKKIQINFASGDAYYGGGQKGPITIAEMKFYYYDDLEEQIKNLFKDDLRIELVEGVTLAQIEALEVKANTKDDVSGEYHPTRDVILQDLAYAKKLLQDTNVSDVITIDQSISNSKNSHLGFAMALNDYQPLGIVAKAGDTIAIYVGSTGNVSNLELVFTQYYPESGSWKKTQKNLVKGQNLITIPQITSMDVEKGGSVYLRYTSNKETNSPIKVRVSGGTKIPVLDIHGKPEEEKKEAIKNYVQALNTYVEKLPSAYANRGETYEPTTSIQNSTEIVLDDVMLSVSASKVLEGLKTNTTSLEEQETKLTNTAKAFDEMMNLFYKEKGLQKNSEDAKNEWPGSRINIRYTRMFDGAFMYATGEHIGIGFGSIAGLMNGKPAQVTEDGSVTTQYFGWGIAHEIGHVIDEGSMVVGETTNNIFSLFAQTADDKSLSRLETSNKYPEIYEKVTSHTTGLPSNVFVSLGMFWQLHLAYDDEATLTSTNTFYSRLNTLYRQETWGNEVDKYNKLIRLASDAVTKDLTEFFEAWGLKADDATKAYLEEKGYEKETRPIYYLNDEARRYRLNNGTALQTQVSANLELVTENKQTKLSFNSKDGQDKLLGYEIRRNGQSIGFTINTEYIDELNALNNRVLNYEIVAYDKLLNEVGKVTLEPVKIEYDGTIHKTGFSITSNYRNENDENEYENENSVIGSIKNIMDGDTNTYFNGNVKKVATDKTNPSMVIDLNEELPICGLRYTAAIENEQLLENTIKKYKIYISSNNETWEMVKTGTFAVSKENPTTQIYFDAPGSTGGNQLYTATASYVKIEVIGNKGISGAELDIIAPPGDNITMKEENIYRLEEDYTYAEGETIPAGSVIFKGEYRGNPAYNAALLIDEEGNTVENYSQLFMAELPENAPLDEIASGHWIAYMTKENYDKLCEKGKVKVQLYRVNNPETLEGQRLVSDTFKIPLTNYEQLQKIKLQDEL